MLPNQSNEMLAVQVYFHNYFASGIVRNISILKHLTSVELLFLSVMCSYIESYRALRFSMTLSLER